MVASLAHGQVQRGHDVTVCTTDAFEAQRRLPDQWRRGDDNIALRVFPNLSNTLAYHLQFFVPLGLEAYLRRHAGDFDVAHVHGCHNLPGAIAAGCLSRAGVPYVLATHGTALLALILVHALTGDIHPAASAVANAV